MSDLTPDEVDVLLRYVASPEEVVKDGPVQRRFELIDPDDVDTATDSLLERGFLEWHPGGFYRSAWLVPTPLGREAADRLLTRE
jgi:hypothetical protein